MIRITGIYNEIAHNYLHTRFNSSKKYPGQTLIHIISRHIHTHINTFHLWILPSNKFAFAKIYKYANLIGYCNCSIHFHYNKTCMRWLVIFYYGPWSFMRHLTIWFSIAKKLNMQINHQSTWTLQGRSGCLD